jgi:Mg/Co/Ni transporter MgtE
MHDDDAMDRLLRGALTANVPQLSPAFDQRVMRRVRPRRLTRTGRAVMGVYGVMAAVITVWLMQGLPVTAIVAAAAIGVPVAAATAVYGRRLAVG